MPRNVIWPSRDGFFSRPNSRDLAPALATLAVLGLAGTWSGYSWSVKRYVLAYGALGGLLIALLKFIEYRYLVVEHSIEIYGGLVALVFAALGIRLGLTLTRATDTIVVREVAVPAPSTFVQNVERLQELRITPRELQILELIAGGLSNREIAERIFVSENTVKTHSSRLFDKLSARRRTQAVQIGKQLGLIP
jgi:two-component system, NarL family, response regulator LiaR